MSKLDKQIAIAIRHGEEIARTSYNAGFDEGAKSVYEIWRMQNDGVTTLKTASDDEKEKWSYFGLAAWCEKCEKGISGAWGLISFCPHCGRKVVRKDKPNDE